ncbi:MAG: cardiolipin synthase [Pseudomonadales bacterium]
MDILRWSIVLLGGLLSAWGAGHALLNKRDPRSAVAWIAVCFVLPFLGALLYYVFGKNRILTRARRLRLEKKSHAQEFLTEQDHPVSILDDYINLAELSWAASRNNLLGGNSVAALHNGDNAYPAMLHAIENAKAYIYLTTYIFDTREIGKQFMAALAAALARGVVVKVLIDGVGEKYGFPWASLVLRRLGVDTALYLPPTLLPPSLTINLRNHRKLLLIDSELGFTGGMNIRNNHVLARSKNGVIDMHFLLRGPILRQMERTFINDWLFSTGEALECKPKENYIAHSSNMACRVLLEGPDEDNDKLTWVLVGAISVARKSIAIMTPYFLPSRELEVALLTAALRGVKVHIVLPGKNNMPFMTWAVKHMAPGLIDAGVKICFSSGPFVHTKLFVVDDYYVQVGSSNLDARSLRLNFELVVEVYDRQLGVEMGEHIRTIRRKATPLSAAELRRRNVFVRVWNAFFWLFSPYL